MSTSKSFSLRKATQNLSNMAECGGTAATVGRGQRTESGRSLTLHQRGDQRRAHKGTKRAEA